MSLQNQLASASAARCPRPPPPGSTQRTPNVAPGKDPENSLIVREALRMNLPQHLVLRNVQRRLRTHGRNYVDISELVSDLFTPRNKSRPPNDEEVPMETDQLEDFLMMSTEVVKKALKKGVPPHLLKPKVRAKILSNQVGYTDVQELLRDVYKK
ncbi:uncharacterized protein V6R79_003132 [Siganus canaliculatus]